MSVSVLMPVYNTEPEYLSQAIESILSQTYSDFELLIYDDASVREDTLSTLDRYAEKDPRIRIIHGRKNAGVAVARNTLIAEAKNRLCAFLDSDDIAKPFRLERQVEFFESHPDFGICGGWFHRFPSDTTIAPPARPGFMDFLRENCLGNSTVMFDRELYAKFGLRFNENLPICEDYDIYTRAVRYMKIANLQEVLVEYRERPDSLSHADMGALSEADSIIHKDMMDFLTEDESLRGGISELLAEMAPGKRPSFFTRLRRCFRKSHHHRS
ncbi:MAG: glycosyltransferase family 2 protein [Bacteroidales bacterium]|nr:glycosyltransferase family 2 protein [Bacteroidales bacterium]